MKTFILTYEPTLMAAGIQKCIIQIIPMYIHIYVYIEYYCYSNAFDCAIFKRMNNLLHYIFTLFILLNMAQSNALE